MRLRSLLDQRRLKPKVEESRAIDTQTAESIKILGQDVTTIFPAQEALLRNANVAPTYTNHDVKATIFPLPPTIDASVFIDQPQPAVSFKEVRRETLELPTLVIDQKKKEDNAREQEAKKEYEKRGEGKKTPEANDFCISETRGEEKDRGETCVKKSTRREMLDEDISPMKLTEMISNSIREAVQTIVKQCSMEEEKTSCPRSKDAEKASRACRTRISKEHCKEVSSACDNRRITCRIPRRYNNLPIYGDPHPYSRTHEDAIPVKNKVNNDRKVKKSSKQTSNVNTDNRRMTGNVNIYICSEANDKGQANFEKKLKPRFCTDMSSDSITGRSNSRCVSASSVSSCKLLNSIQVKRRRKSQAQQPLNSIQDNQKDKIGDNSDDNTVCDDGICSRESNESCKERTNSRITDENIGREDTISSTRDGCCCDDASDMDLRRQGSVHPCSSLDTCGNSKQPRSWTTIYPSEAKARLDGSDVSLPRAICIDVDRRSHRKNYDRSNDVCKNDGEYTACRAVDGSNWLPKSIYTDCATNDKIVKERFTNDRKYRNKKLQVSPLNRNAVWRKQVGYKLMQQSSGSCQKEHVARQWSTCSCIVEEEEDYCTNVDTAEQKPSENLCDVAGRVEKISVCRTPSSESAKNAIVCVTSFKDTGELFEKTQTCKSIFRDLVECRRSTTVCATTLGNSEEPPKVTRVCKEFVAEEPRQDIIVCRTIFAEPKVSPKEETVCKTELPDFEETPEEIIRKVHDSSFVEQGDVNKMISLNDAKDKLVKEKADNNLNGRKENAINLERAVIQSDGKYSNIVSTDLAGHKSAKETNQNKQIARNALSNQSKGRIPSVGQIRDSKSLSRDIYSIISPRGELYNRDPNLSSNRNAKEASKTFDERQRARRTQLLPFHQPTRGRFRQSNIISKDPVMRDIAWSKSNQAKEKISQKSRDEKENIPNKTGAIKEKSKDTALRRSFKRLIDVIRREKVQYKDEIETEKSEPKAKTITDNRLNTTKSKSVVRIENKISDGKDNRDDNKKVHAPTTSQFAGKREINENAVHIKRPTARAGDFTEEGKKIDISGTIHATRLKPKLLRIIATKKMYLRRTEAAARTEARETEAESARAEITTNEQANQEEISQEPVPAIATEEIKTEESIAPKISVDEVKDVPKDVNDSSKDIANKSLDTTDKEASKDVAGESMESNATCSQRKLRTERPKLVPCTRGIPIDPSKIRPCVLVKCVKCNSPLEECLYMDNGLRREEVCCAHRYSSTRQCVCTATRYPRTRFKTDKPKFRSVSLSKNDAHTYANRRGIREECECRNIAVCLRCRRYDDECRCGTCETCSNCLRSVAKCKCRPATDCINCCRPWDECCCVATALVERHKIKRGRSGKKAMICLYCDNPQGKCTCRAPIGKCSCCGPPSDVCDYQDDESRGRDHERVIERSNENRTTQVTSWKPKKEIRRYFARDRVDHRSDDNDECRCHEKPKRQRPEELPYQRLNVFSDVMNELQRKMSESVCCTRCRRNPCYCGSHVDQDERKGESRVKGYVRCPEMEKSKSKSPRDYRCSSSPGNERKDTIRKSILTQRVDCVCKLSPCRCTRGRVIYKKPLAKCYYCKSSPCT